MARDERVSDVMATIAEPFRRLRDAGHRLPDDLSMQAAVTACLTRTGTWRKSCPYGSPGELLWKLVKFHGSGGSLYGIPWDVVLSDREQFDQWDTAAQALRIAHGAPMTASAAWQSVLS